MLGIKKVECNIKILDIFLQLVLSLMSYDSFCPNICSMCTPQ